MYASRFESVNHAFPNLCYSTQSIDCSVLCDLYLHDLYIALADLSSMRPCIQPSLRCQDVSSLDFSSRRKPSERYPPYKIP